LGWTYRFGEAEALQLSHSADHGGPCIGVYHVIAGSSTIDNAVVPESFRWKRAVERGPAIGLDLRVKVASDLNVAPGP
jgi:hypothetical protein